MPIGSLAAQTSLITGLMTGLALSPIEGKPVYHFDYEGPILTLVRAERISKAKCSSWIDATVQSSPELGTPLTDGERTLKTAWEPWGEKDLEAVETCDDFPCKVKFNHMETDEMKKVPVKDRLKQFIALVSARVNRYLKTGERPAYEKPGAPIDPWKVLEDKGFKPSLKKPDAPNLLARKLNFDPNRMLTLHQVIDRRSAKSPNEAMVWIRDAYTDHYFDSWGEGTLMSCDSATGDALMVQILISEMDLLKNTGLFAHALFPKYRKAFEENGKVLLDREFSRVEKAAQK